MLNPHPTSKHGPAAAHSRDLRTIQQTRCSPQLPNTLLAVEVSAREASTGPGSALAVVLRGGRRIEVGRGFDTGALEQLVRVLEGV